MQHKKLSPKTFMFAQTTILHFSSLSHRMYLAGPSVLYLSVFFLLQAFLHFSKAMVYEMQSRRNKIVMFIGIYWRYLYLMLDV